MIDAGKVILRPYKDEDLEPLIAVLQAAEVMKLTLEERVFTRDEAERFIGSYFAIAGDSEGFLTISVKATDETIGFAGYRQCQYLGANDLEFGWVIAKGHQGLGYATAIGAKLISHALENLKLKRIFAACHPANVASEHVLRDKLGMRFEREVEVRPNYRRRVYAAQHLS
jgi:RimJ/RimL family protein N-acetyltransferase